jgi:hypothetical protein
VDDNQPFDYQGPLAEVEHVPQELAAFIHMHQEIWARFKIKLFYD